MPAPRLKVLFATRTSPFAGDSGSGTYVFDLLQYLSQNGFEVHVVWTEPPDLVPSRGWYTPPPESTHVCTLEIFDTVRIGRRFWRASVIWLPFKARASHALKSTLRTLRLWRDRPRPAASSVSSAFSPSVLQPSWGAPASPSETTFIRAAIARLRPDVVLANYAWIAPAIRSLGTPSTFNLQSSTPASVADVGPPFAVLTHDVRHRQLHLRDGKPVEVLNEHTPLTTELALLAPADALIAIQSAEAAVFERLFPTKPIVTAPMPVRPSPLPPATGSVALFVGSNHGPNVAGLRWFLTHVWPLIRHELPTARLLIAGSVSSQFPTPQPSGVEVLGRLPDLAPAYAQATAVIAPILQGSGIKIKILEAISHGRPCVTTSIGLEGLDTLLPALRIADTPETFAEEVLQLLRAPGDAADTAAALQILALTHLSAEACYAPVVHLLRTLAARNSHAL